MDLNVKDYTTIISSLIGLIGALAGLYTLYLRHIELKNNAEQFKLEKQHQITKETYQKLFSQKIELYIKLQSIVNNFYNELKTIGNESYDFDIINGDTKHKVSGNTIIQNLFNSLETEVKNNTLIISDTLSEQYKKVNDPFKNLQNDIKNAEEVLGQEEASPFYTEASFTFHKNNKKEIKIFLNLVNNEIKEIRNQIGFN